MGRWQDKVGQVGHEAWAAHVTTWLALAAKRKRQRLQDNATKGVGVVAGGGGRSQDDPEVARHVTNPRFGMAHTRDASRIIKPVETVRAALVAQHGEAAGGRRFARC